MMSKSNTSVIIFIALQIGINLAIQHIDHLVPPPQHHRILNSRIRPPPPPPTESSGFMQRIARWLGFGNGSKGQQQLDGNFQYHQQYNHLPQAYQYNPPKAACNLCNKAPWVPMFSEDLHYSIHKGHSNQQVNIQSNQQNQRQYNNNFHTNQHINLPTYAPPPNNVQSSFNNLPASQNVPAFHFQPPLVQRAVKFKFPLLNGVSNINPNIVSIGNGFRKDKFFLPPPPPPPAAAAAPPLHIAPIPVPNLSATPLPPLYGPIPFNKNPAKYNGEQIHIPLHFEYVEASELQTVTPSELSSTLPKNHKEDSSVEIIQSLPVTEYTSSVEYPANVIQSQIIDVTPPPPPHKQKVESTTFSSVPKLIELGSYEPVLPTRIPDYSFESLIVRNFNTEPDNYPEASSHNLTYRNERFEDVVNYISSTPEPFRSTYETTAIQTDQPNENILKLNAEVESIRDTGSSAFQPSDQVSKFQNTDIATKKERQTPKRLLDSPVLYITGSSPRPFTRDPSELHVRSSTYSNHNLLESSPTPTPWLLIPTPTSTYSSIDASGQFAGISPPSQFQPAPVSYLRPGEKSPKQFHQIIVPYTTKNKPRPFRTREEQLIQSPENDIRYVNWSQSQEFELHEQQESKVVTATETPTKKTTKYLTKILASNIRDLLKKEYDIENKSKSTFDFSKLQKNIDDWTQQEFTSLTHKASTISLRGPSKNIPSEYLTTTPSLRQATPTAVTAESPQITTRFESLLDEQELKKYEFLVKLIEDNQISNTENFQEINENIAAITTTAATVTTTTPPTTTTTISSSSTTTKEPPVSPFYIRRVSTTSEIQPWENLKVSISPLTKEKVYVVTPQSSFQQQKSTTDSVGMFKSPRFLIRPTPGTGPAKSYNNSTFESVTSGYSPELFGLMGLSAYIPSAPVETLDGHSKVITVITPAPSKKQSSEFDISKSITNKGNSTSDGKR